MIGEGIGQGFIWAVCVLGAAIPSVAVWSDVNSVPLSVR